MGTAPEPLPVELTADEKTMASLAHILQIVGWWIASLIIFLIKRESKFVSFHAVQALFFQLFILAMWAVVMVAMFAAMFATMPMQPMPRNAPPPPAFFIMFPVIWLAMMGGWLLVLIAAIVYGVKAGRGEWASVPVFGALARRVLHIRS